ncbi:MAG TPA: protein kinase, partial [Gemmataceae bacterium]
MSTSESKSAIVLELAEEFLERYRQGERPSLKEYIDSHPELAAEIKEVFPAMALMENVALADESLAGAATGPAIPPESLPPQQLGDYRILREVGRGGMGIVYEAEQVSLGRHVALKVLPRQVFVDDSQRRRFEREAKAAAKLHHTNIVPVFGVGEHDGMPYYVMQFIQGLGLDDVLEELKRMQGSGPATVTGGELRVSRKDVSVADVARSLLTGDFPEGERGGG